jgi:hypothetical protein
MEVHVGNRTYNILAEAAPTGAPDLDITSLASPGRVKPLAGHPVLKRESDGRTVYTGGVHVSFTLSHNGSGRTSVLVRGLALEILQIRPGDDPEYSHQLEGAAIIGAGIVRPHVFTVALLGEKPSPARWVEDAGAGRFRVARSANFFDTEEPRLISLAPEADVEEIQGTVLAQESGFYALRFAWDYSAKGEDRRKASETVFVYAQD